LKQTHVINAMLICTFTDYNNHNRSGTDQRHCYK